jgi:hypothetical protein
VNVTMIDFAGLTGPGPNQNESLPKFHRSRRKKVSLQRLVVLEPYLGEGATLAGFLTTSSYALSSSKTQNHSAISQVGSSLWSLGGLTQAFMYDLASSMMICIFKVS